jgi:CheY-like chemotaxis protein
VVERHEGNIEIQSEIGKGTTFRLIFPVRKIRVENEIAENDDAIEPLRILCIDDEPLLRDLMKELLESEGHTVQACDGGQSGIDAFRAAQAAGNNFDVVFTDLGMPYVDGKQVVKTVKDESRATPVVMLTGWGAFIKEEDSLVTEVDAILSKPPRSREIRDTLRRVAGRTKHQRGNKVPGLRVARAAA